MNNIRKLRTEAGLSQLALAEKFNLTQQSICKYENNQANPDTITAIRMAEFFQVSVEYLVGYSTQKVKEDSHYQIDFTREEIDMVHKYRTLKPDVRLAVNTFIDTLSPHTHDQSDTKYFTI